jgi:hypothetical protein
MYADAHKKSGNTLVEIDSQTNAIETSSSASYNNNNTNNNQ